MATQRSNSEHEGKRRVFSRRRFISGAAIGAGVAMTDIATLSDLALGATNSITTENALVGVDDWDLEWVDDSIEGFALPYSSNAGETVSFKVRTASTNYRVRIYRLGWYGGLGARHIADITPSVSLPQNQPAPITDAATGLVDCGNWATSATWTVPADSRVGRLRTPSSSGSTAPASATACLFVVRNDGARATSSCRRPTRPGRPTTCGAATASTRGY